MCQNAQNGIYMLEVVLSCKILYNLELLLLLLLSIIINEYSLKTVFWCIGCHQGWKEHFTLWGYEILFSKFLLCDTMIFYFLFIVTVESESFSFSSPKTCFWTHMQFLKQICKYSLQTMEEEEEEEEEGGVIKLLEVQLVWFLTLSFPDFWSL